MIKKVSSILKFAGLGIMLITCILGIVMLSKYISYKNYKTITPTSEVLVNESEFVQVEQSRLKKENYRNSAMALIPWSVSLMLVGTCCIVAGTVLEMDKKQLQVK